MTKNRLICFYFSLILLTSATCAIAEPDQDWQSFKGAWFSVAYPSVFSVRPSLKSRTSVRGYDSVFFISPDRFVEFYVFSPQWNGEPSDIALNPKSEEIVSEKIDKKDDETVRWFTIGAKDKSYRRSYVDKENKQQNTRLVFGIKYRDQNAYNTYRRIYEKLVKSLRQYGD